MHYTLLPAANQDGLHLSVDGQPTPSISTYGEKCNGAIVVQSGNAKLPDSAYNLLLEKDIPITTSFTDVDEGEWYAQAVHVLASLGILNGVGNGCFEPQRWITRAEFTAIAMRFAKLDTSGSDIFPDVNREDWFYDQVVCAGERKAERSREWLWPLCREKQYDKIKKQVTRGEGGLHENHIPIFPRSFQ